MTLDDFLARLDAVRSRGSGAWSARCPSHDDSTPSLSIHQGHDGVLVKCWVGCDAEMIVSAMGLRMPDLFYDSALSPEERQRMPRQPKSARIDWRGYADDLAREADGLWLRGVGVLEHASDLDIQDWRYEDIDEAMEAVSQARTDLARAECFNRLAFNVRAYGLKKENERAS